MLSWAPSNVALAHLLCLLVYVLAFAEVEVKVVQATADDDTTFAGGDVYGHDDEQIVLQNVPESAACI